MINQLQQLQQTTGSYCNFQVSQGTVETYLRWGG